MAKVVGVKALKAKLSEYLRAVKAGDVFLVTERNMARALYVDTSAVLRAVLETGTTPGELDLLTTDDRLRQAAGIL